MLPIYQMIVDWRLIFKKRMEKMTCIPNPLFHVTRRKMEPEQEETVEVDNIDISKQLNSKIKK